MNPWLSILIPVYNVEAYLEECVESVLSQCDASIEIIILDDRSTDGSFQLINRIVKNSSHVIKIIQHEENCGISAARNSLVAAATGEYLWFLDSDDALTPGAVAQLHNIVQEYSPDLVMCDYRIWRADAKALMQSWVQERHIHTFAGAAGVLLSNPMELFAGLYKKGKLHCWSKISKRTLWLTGLKFPEGKYYEDMVTTQQLALSVKNYFYIPNVWVLYRRRAGSILTTPSIKKIEDMSTGVSGVLDAWIKRYPDMDAATRFVFISYCVKVYIFTIKELRKIGQLNPETLSVYRLRLYEDIKINKYTLIKQFFLHGNPFRLLKCWRFL